MEAPDRPAAEPRLAATLVLLRPARHPPELLLTTRPPHLRFMGGAAVFPGGAVSAADLDPRWERLSARSAEDAARLLDLDDPRLALAYLVAALRETFEEVGLLLAEGKTTALTRDHAEDAAAFLEACEAEDLRLRTDLLLPAGRWVTPLGAPVRFDTRFFVAEAPPGWEPIPDPREVDRCWWTTPARALEALASGELAMAPPTIEMLQRLEGHTSLSDIGESLLADPVGHKGEVISVRVSPLVHLVLAPNPGVMTGPGTNTYIVGAGRTCVIDPAVTDAGYLETVAAAAGEVSEILVTHRHPDHVGGVAALAQRFRCPVRAYGSDPVGETMIEPLSDGELVEFGGGGLEALHTPGHALDHLCFYLRESASLFSGDNILGEGTAVIAPPEGNMRSYLASLERLRELHIDRIYPGHFRPLHGGAAVVDGYLQHRAQRRQAVLDALGAGADSPEQIVETVYTDTPSHLHPIAVLQVASMLELLEEEGRAAFLDERWVIADVE